MTQLSELQLVNQTIHSQIIVTKNFEVFNVNGKLVEATIHSQIVVAKHEIFQVFKLNCLIYNATVSTPC
jgi:hypothetical protein